MSILSYGLAYQRTYIHTHLLMSGCSSSLTYLYIFVNGYICLRLPMLMLL